MWYFNVISQHFFFQLKSYIITLSYDSRPEPELIVIFSKTKTKKKKKKKWKFKMKSIIWIIFKL